MFKISRLLFFIVIIISIPIFVIGYEVLQFHLDFRAYQDFIRSETEVVKNGIIIDQNQKKVIISDKVKPVCDELYWTRVFAGGRFTIYDIPKALEDAESSLHRYCYKFFYRNNKNVKTENLSNEEIEVIRSDYNFLLTNSDEIQDYQLTLGDVFRRYNQSDANLGISYLVVVSFILTIYIWKKRRTAA